MQNLFQVLNSALTILETEFSHSMSMDDALTFNPYQQNGYIKTSFQRLLQYHLGNKYSETLHSSIVPSHKFPKYAVYQGQVCELSKTALTFRHYVPISNFHWLVILNSMLWVCSNLLRQRCDLSKPSYELTLSNYGLIMVFYNCIFLLHRANANCKQTLTTIEDYNNSNYAFINPVKLFPELKTMPNYIDLDKYLIYLSKKIIKYCIDYKLNEQANQLDDLITGLTNGLAEENDDE